MDFQEALKIIDSSVFSTTQLHLTDTQLLVLRGAWENKTYQKIADEAGYSEAYLRQDIAPKLWELLSKSFGEKIGKKRLKTSLERLQRPSTFVMCPSASPVSLKSINIKSSGVVVIEFYDSLAR